MQFTSIRYNHKSLLHIFLLKIHRLKVYLPSPEICSWQLTNSSSSNSGSRQWCWPFMILVLVLFLLFLSASSLFCWLVWCSLFSSLTIWNVTSHDIQANTVWRYETWLRAGAYSDLSVRMSKGVRGRKTPAAPHKMCDSKFKMGLICELQSCLSSVRALIFSLSER